MDNKFEDIDVPYFPESINDDSKRVREDEYGLKIEKKEKFRNRIKKMFMIAILASTIGLGAVVGTNYAII